MKHDQKQQARALRELLIKSRRLVNDHMAGIWQSQFKGRGVEFEEIRQYTPGDDVQRIDWSVSSRLREPYIRTYSEERQLTVYFMVDISGSMFTLAKKSKIKAAAELVALLSAAAQMSNDRIGLILFSDHIEKIIPAKNSKNTFMQICHALFEVRERHHKSSFQKLSENFITMQKKSTVCFLVSDFNSTAFTAPLQKIAAKHDLSLIQLKDPLEERLPAIKNLNLQDSRTQKEVSISVNPKQYAALQKKRFQQIEEEIKHSAIPFLTLNTTEDPLPPLKKFLQKK